MTKQTSPRKIRIATVTATGRRYVVQQLDFNTEKAHVWGEVVSYTARGNAVSSKHAGSKASKLDAVQVEDALMTPALAAALFAQADEAARAGKLPGYVSEAEGKAIDRQRRRQRKAARTSVRTAILAAQRGSLEPMLALLDAAMRPAAKRCACEMCGAPSTTTIEDVHVCGACAAELA